MKNLVQHRVSPITGEPCCSRAVQSESEKGEMQAYINRFRVPRKSTALIRTGCIPCLNQGVKCDGTNPRCRKASITEAWRINSGLDWQYQGTGRGTWRDRRGIHAFINFALAPERTGLFESVFWHKTVVQACFSNDAVFYVASAIGALLEHKAQSSFNSGLKASDGLAFALNQCNRAIKLLTVSGKNIQRASCDPGIVLITCVLFAIFEALHGDSEQAISHALQGRKLLRNCEMLASTGQGSRILDPTAVRPVIGCLEIQAKALQGKKMEISDQIETPPMPDVERIHGLEHANWTLHYGYISLLTFCQNVTCSPPKFASQMRQKQLLFLPWLQTWEKSFSEFLFREAKSLSLADIQRAKVLKANHLVATMVTATDDDTWAYCDDDCKAIIDLSASVLTTYSLGPLAPFNSLQFPYLTFGLWVTEPLFIVMSRSRNPELQRQAAGLLSGQGHHGILLDNPNIQKDTDDWHIEQWIEFSMHTRLDTGMATYFARLPSDYIEKPYYAPLTPDSLDG